MPGGYKINDRNTACCKKRSRGPFASSLSFIPAAAIYSLAWAFLLSLTGCARSIIDIETKSAAASYPMLGNEPFRDFYYPVNLGDSLVEKWQADINGGFSNSSVTIHDHFVFVNDLSGRIFCFDINTGKIAGQLKHKGAVFTSPLLHNTTLIYAYSENNENRSELVVYDFSEGKFIAEADNINGRLLTEMIKAEDGVIFTTENGKIYKYSFGGEKIYEFDTNSFSHSSPSLMNNILVFGNDKGEITGFDSKNQKVLYREKISEVLLSGVSISGEISFVGDYNGVLYAIDLNTGKKLWSYNTGKRINMIPSSDDQYVYIGNLGGELYSIKKADGKLLWMTKTDGVLNAAPMITENLVFTPDLNKKLHLIGKDDGRIKKTLEFEGRIKLTPVYFNNLLFLGFENGILAAYEILN